MNHPANSPLRVQDLGRMPYAPCLSLQRGHHQQVLDGHPPILLLVEHDPVITLTRRPAAQRHVLADSATLAAAHIDLQPTDRGGDVTYHGPGQLVAYPILRLADLGLNVGRYMRLLEQIVIDAVARFDVQAHRDACATGVWIGPAKLAALGVRVRRNVTLHGLSLNVTTNLHHFSHIVPCGLANRSVTSLQELLPHSCPSMDQVKAALTDAFQHHFIQHRQAVLTRGS